MSIRVAIILPPVWSTDTPYLGTATLAAICTELGTPHQVFDCNLAYWRWLTTGERKLAILRKLEALPAGHPTRLRLGGCGLELEAALDCALADPKRRRELVSLVTGDEAAEATPRLTAPYHDRFFNSMSLSEHALDSEELWRLAHDDRRNPFGVALSDTLAQIADYHADLVLITVTSVSQALAAYTIARLLRETTPGAKVAAGGAWVTALWPSIARAARLMEVIPYLARFDGEATVPGLYALAAGRAGARDVPNLVWKDRDGSIVSNDIAAAKKLDDLPTPEFDEFELTRYDYRGTLSLQASRGCCYGACTFCSYPLLEPGYRVMSADRVKMHMATLAARHGATTIVFADAILAPGFLRRLVSAARDGPLPCRFTGYARFHEQFDPGLFTELARIGCTGLVWGLETADPRLQQTLDKALPSLSRIEAILTAAQNAGLENRVTVMYGIPGETFEQAIATIDFLRTQAPRLHSITYSRFTLERGTPLAGGANPVDSLGVRDLSLSMPLPNAFSQVVERAVLAEYGRLDAWLTTRAGSLNVT